MESTVVDALDTLEMLHCPYWCRLETIDCVSSTSALRPSTKYPRCARWILRLVLSVILILSVGSKSLALEFSSNTIGAVARVWHGG
ncbi:uncharacterized protein BCR38DRAFT_394742 [Pseudomassariella vexata]|uniref:Uncharacterized protein n=1 Tax=Pseudomassariella vexata TaxID=1141098 RepID=A0A1Y2DSH2_9PEZI|nr:uncharacterized protein BCR38DRAFT_394742 [Pseudomassariella vexata]ORY62104.1 hypothetical protein BCR38DRAFT_394742 [Pseudomassariella vexata]